MKRDSKINGLAYQEWVDKYNAALREGGYQRTISGDNLYQYWENGDSWEEVSKVFLREYFFDDEIAIS